MESRANLAEIGRDAKGGPVYIFQCSPEWQEAPIHSLKEEQYIHLADCRQYCLFLPS
jgi:hypothetical protein